MNEKDFEKYNEKPTQEELENLSLEDNDKFHELVHYYFVNDPLYYIQTIKPALENLSQHINLDNNTLVNQNLKSKKWRKTILYIFLGLFFIVFITIILILNREDSPEELLNKGKIEVNSGNDSLAILYFNKCIGLRPDFAEAYNERGYVYYHLRNYDKALQDFNIAIDLKPENHEPYYWRGNVYFETKYYDNAIKDYTKAIELKNNYIAAYNKRGKIYFLQNKYDESLKDLSLVIDNNSTDAEVYFERGSIYNSLKQFTKAVNDFNKAISLNKDYSESYHGRADAFISLNNYEKALEDYNKEIEIMPNKPELYLNRVLLFYGTGLYCCKSHEKALSDLTKAIQLKLDYAEAYYYRCLLYYEMGDVENTMKDFESVSKLNDTLKKELAFIILTSKKDQYLSNDKTIEGIDFTQFDTTGWVKLEGFTVETFMGKSQGYIKEKVGEFSEVHMAPLIKSYQFILLNNKDYLNSYRRIQKDLNYKFGEGKTYFFSGQNASQTDWFWNGYKISLWIVENNQPRIIIQTLPIN